MKKSVLTKFIFMLFFSSANFALADSNLTNPNGEDLIKWDDAAKRVISGKPIENDESESWAGAGFISGVISANNGIVFCTKSQVSLRQSYAVVRKYLDDNPDKWKERAGVLINTAMEKSFPCYEYIPKKN